MQAHAGSSCLIQSDKYAFCASNVKKKKKKKKEKRMRVRSYNRLLQLSKVVMSATQRREPRGAAVQGPDQLM